MKKVIITPLDWDTEFFNIRCGRAIIEDEEIDISDFEELFKHYDFVSIQNVGNNIRVNKAISQHTNAFLADINVQFEKELICSNEQLDNNEHCGFSLIKAMEISPELCDEMLVEELDFKYSKFVCDPELNNRKGYLVYREWIKNARKDNNKYFALFYDNKKIGAYILFNVKDEVCTIELVKVNSEFQGRHIATFMIKQIENIMRCNNISTLRVGTQFNNIPAMNLYHTLGFKEISRTSVFHCWNIEKED